MLKAEFARHRPGMRGALRLRVVSLARLHDEVFVGGGQIDLVVARAGDGLVGGVAEAVLVAQLLLNLGIDLIDRLFLRHFKEAAASFAGDALQDFLAIGMRGLLRTAHSAARPAPTTVAAHASARIALVAVGFGVGVQNGVNQRVGALRSFDGTVQADFAAGIHSVGKDDEGLATLYLFRYLIRSKENSVIQVCTPAHVMAATTAAAGMAASATPSTLRTTAASTSVAWGKVRIVKLV